MSYSNFEILLYLGEKYGLFKEFRTSTSKIAKDLNISQQSASRILRELEEKELIERTPTIDGIKIKINENSRKLLDDYFLKLKKIFKEKAELKGIVKSGLGEGRYYVEQEGYETQFKKKLGYTAYPGTLNIEVNNVDKEMFLANSEIIKLDGFKTKERSFGALICYKIKIKNTEAAIVIPERTKHSNNVVEVIAAVNLREKFGLKDNDEIIIKK